MHVLCWSFQQESERFDNNVNGLEKEKEFAYRLTALLRAYIIGLLCLV